MNYIFQIKIKSSVKCSNCRGTRGEEKRQEMKFEKKILDKNTYHTIRAGPKYPYVENNFVSTFVQLINIRKTEIYVF